MVFIEVKVCNGDSGGGLVIRDPFTKAYQLKGVLSMGRGGCNSDFALFTAVSWHREFIKEALEYDDFPNLG